MSWILACLDGHEGSHILIAGDDRGEGLEMLSSGDRSAEKTVSLVVEGELKVPRRARIDSAIR